MTFRKYEFTAAQWTAAKKKIQHEDYEGNLVWDYSKVTSVYDIGKICQETNKEGECIKQAKKISVDILWTGEPLTTSFASYIVWPVPSGIHTFAGWETQYAKDYCSNNPETEFCNPPEPIEP
jgi:hypothetical protein